MTGEAEQLEHKRKGEQAPEKVSACHRKLPWCLQWWAGFWRRAWGDL